MSFLSSDFLKQRRPPGCQEAGSPWQIPKQSRHHDRDLRPGSQESYSFCSSPAVKKGIILSEDPEFKTQSAALSAKQADDVTNITYSWLPVDLDTSKDGEHNGDNYVAYTFYCKNNGQATLDYDAVLEITGVAKSADEAVRVMVYKNGEPTIYGKGKYDDRNTAETDCTKFNTDTEVMTTATEDFKVGDVDKYTIVIWIEGNDPECIDDIRNGHIRMRMLFSVRDDETTAPAN